MTELSRRARHVPRATSSSSHCLIFIACGMFCLCHHVTKLLPRLQERPELDILLGLKLTSVLKSSPPPWAQSTPHTSFLEEKPEE